MTQQKIDAKVAELRAICKEKGYAFFEGDYNLNVIAVRNDDIFDNEFTDTLYVAYQVKGVWCLLEIAWTTMPGTFGGVYNPITVFGITGTAVLKEGQYRRAYQCCDTTKNAWGAPVFAQVELVTVYRDGDRDNVFDRDMPQQTGHFGIFIHPMGDGRYINGWSIGCQGATNIEYKKLVELARAQVRAGLGTWFTYTLLHKNDFAQRVTTSPKKTPKGDDTPKTS